MSLKPEEILLFTGDSITDCGRDRRPEAPLNSLNHRGGPRSALGTGYVRLIDSFLRAFSPEKNIRILNTGIAGDGIAELFRRRERDILALRPHRVSLLIGINDIRPLFPAEAPFPQSNPEAFRSLYAQLIESLRPSVKNLLLITPFSLELAPDDPPAGSPESSPDRPMRRKTDRYAGIVKDLARRNGLPLLDMQTVFGNYLRLPSAHPLSGDQIHPNDTGHMLLARAVLEALGLAPVPSPSRKDSRRASSPES